MVPGQSMSTPSTLAYFMSKSWYSMTSLSPEACEVAPTPRCVGGRALRSHLPVDLHGDAHGDHAPGKRQIASYSYPLIGP
jgi:hypothetical protein